MAEYSSSTVSSSLRSSSASEVVVADHRQHAQQHALDDVGLVQRLARGAGDGQRGRGQRRRVQVVRAAGHQGASGLGQQFLRERAPPACQAYEQDGDHHVEAQVEQHDLGGRVAHVRPHMRSQRR
jgi:hypothetical protein